MDNQLRRLTLHQLRVFRAVARNHSFTRAAEELGLTQSGVSAQVRELAGILGTPLFEVIGKRVHLTDSARALEAHAALIEGLVGEIAQHFTALRGAETGLVRIGASTSVGTYVLPSLLAAFAGRHPGIETTLEIHNSALVEERVLRNEFDFGFVGSPPSSRDLAAEPFLDDEIFFAAHPGHTLSRIPAVTIKQLAAERLILREPGSGTRRAMEARLRELGVRFAATTQLGAVEAIKQAVMAGLGISYFSGLTVRHELAEKRLVRLRAPECVLQRGFFAIRHRQKRETPALAAFLGFVRGQVSGSAPAAG